MDFDVIPFEDIQGDWKKLGSGSFGNVYKGSYLGIDVAIKEVLPSNDYDVAKYFEREWRLMKEARHPNVVLYLGLSRAPPPDGRIFIVSEFIENGNLRQYIYDKSKPFGWRLRLSFMTDIARALAYLHARKCIHRDLKGENLLLTSNGRLKITDFGFARIAARNEEESKRLTFCGTDAYMSPEILLGDEFDLPTDVFSLGVIFCEIIARKLADDHTFKRSPPFFGIEEKQLYALASPGCPPDLIALALECCDTVPGRRPKMTEVLQRLRTAELAVMAQTAAEEEQHVGSVKFLNASKRPSAAPRIPSFGMGVNVGGQSNSQVEAIAESSGTDDSDEELDDAIRGLESVHVGGDSLVAPPLSASSTSSWQSPEEWQNQGKASHASSISDAGLPLIDRQHEKSKGTSNSGFSEYSTTVIKGHPSRSGSVTSLGAPPLSSILTVRHQLDPNALPPPLKPTPVAQPNKTNSAMSIDSFHTAALGTYSTIKSTDRSLAAATKGETEVFQSTEELEGQELEVPASTMSSDPSALHHRFTLIKPGAKKGQPISSPGSGVVAGGNNGGKSTPTKDDQTAMAWSPFNFSFFYQGLNTFGAKCDLCGKRLGWKPLLECDDCGLRPWNNVLPQDELTAAQIDFSQTIAPPALESNDSTPFVKLPTPSTPSAFHIPTTPALPASFNADYRAWVPFIDGEMALPDYVDDTAHSDSSSGSDDGGPGTPTHKSKHIETITTTIVDPFADNAATTVTTTTTTTVLFDSTA